MANKALKEQLGEQLNCSICIDTYTDPRQLLCHHIFCQECLVKIQGKEGAPSLTCPICREVTPLPAKGVTGLQPAFNICPLLETYKKLQSSIESPATDKGHEPVRSTAGQPSRVLVSRRCLEHVEELNIYCETCEEVVCVSCISEGGKHHYHKRVLLKKALEKQREDILSSLEPVKKKIANFEGVLAQIKLRCEAVTHKKAATKETIHSTFRQLQEVLSVRETKLISQLSQLTREKLESLEVQRDQVKATLDKLKHCVQTIRELSNDCVMSNAVHHEIMKEAASIEYRPDLYKNVEANVSFKSSTRMTSVCRNYGQVFIPGAPDPSECYASGEGLKAAVVGEMSTVSLHTIDFEGQPCEEPIKSLQCKLLLLGRENAEVYCRTEKGSDSQYTIKYQPTIKGRHLLHVKAEGQHVRGSPFSVTVTSSVEKLGTPIRTTIVEKPWGVAISQKGETVVTELGGNCVSLFNPGGEKITSFGTHGTDQGKFSSPWGVAVDDEGNIVVADKGNHRIQKFTSTGQFLSAVGTVGSGPLQFSYPTGVAFSAGKLYVMDCGNCRVQVLNSDLTFFSTFGKEGSGKGQFGDDVWGIACDSAGKVYVADNHRIQVFMAEGKYLRTLISGTRGCHRYNSLAIDVHGTVYVSEGKCNHHVCVFTSEGQQIRSFGGLGEGPGEFKGPCGIAVDDYGIVYVCDYDNSRVQVF